MTATRPTVCLLALFSMSTGVWGASSQTSSPQAAASAALCGAPRQRPGLQTPIGWKLATEWHIVTALFCYGLSVVIWILALSRVPVSIAFPMLSMAYVVNAVAAWYLLGEPFNPTKLIGMGVIILGVIIISRA